MKYVKPDKAMQNCTEFTETRRIWVKTRKSALTSSYLVDLFLSISEVRRIKLCTAHSQEIDVARCCCGSSQ
jgi:hypothetical protein